MDKVMLMQIVIISLIFLVFVVFTIIHSMRLYFQVKNKEKKKPLKRKLFKRRDSNVYDLKATRTKK